METTQEARPIPPLLKQLSYSSLGELRGCPRRFVLNKLRANYIDRDNLRSVTFAFGHAVGTGIQSTLENKSEQQILWDMFLAWDYGDLYGEEEKSNKSFWTAVVAVQRFKHIRDSPLLADYELLYVDGKPAVELSFRITTPDGFKYRGYVDVVLRNRSTGELLVLELKTTGSSNVSPAQYKNSGQALGYSIVLDKFAPGKSSYKVLYLILQSKTLEYTPMEFTKSYLQRAEWIHTFLMDVQIISMYWEAQHWPQNGANCYNFFRECEHFQTCGISLKNQIPGKNFTAESEEDGWVDEDGTVHPATEFTIDLSLLDLIESQLERA